MVKKKLSEKYQPPESDSSDTAHLVKKAALSFVPGAPDLFEYFVKPPLEKRLEKWREEVARALRYLEDNNMIKLKDLQVNDVFITIVSQATTIAIRTHQKEKLAALKSAILCSATSSKIKDDLQLIFIRFVDELMPSHLHLLKFFIANEQKIKPLTSYPSIYQFFSENTLDTPSKYHFKMLIGDLSVRGLIHVSPDIDDFEEIYQASAILDTSTNDDLPRVLITDIGRDFINYISGDTYGFKS